MIIGIDLGTTYSVVSTVDEQGRAVVLPNKLGELTMPSVVAFTGPGAVLVGSAAKNAAVVAPDRTVSLIKRHMGTDHPLYFGDVEHTPESISALILRGLCESIGADTAEGPTRAVVTVPAYFGIREREATQQACVLAGIEVLELLSEPVAAAIHYGFGAGAPGTCLVYDLGGGTFDATVIRTGDQAEVVATDGDTELGGADWDARLAGHLMAELVRQARPAQDPDDDEAFSAEVLLLAEKTKRELTGMEQRTVTLRYQGSTVSVPVDRAGFEAMSLDLTERTHDYVRRLLSAAAAKGVMRVDRALLVGGSSRMPMIAAGLTAAFGWPVQLHDPDFAVAKGAALRAAQLAGVSATAGAMSDREGGGSDRSRLTGLSNSAVTIARVVPRSFGLLIEDSHTAGGPRHSVEHAIHQNDRLPVIDRELTVATILDNQRAVRIEVFEQAGAVESAAMSDNRRVLDGQLVGLPPLPAGSPLKVGFHLGLDGRLGVTAVEPRSGQSLVLEAWIDGVLDTPTRDRLAQSLSGLRITH